MFSLVIPVYKNETSLTALIEELIRLNDVLDQKLEVVFSVDGSPDRCYEILSNSLHQFPFRCQLIGLSRNFGAFSAIAAGLEHATGKYFAAIAADLQEPPSLVVAFFRALAAGDADIVFGTREARADPLVSRVLSQTFWWIYRGIVNKDMPHGGIDVFGCNLLVRNRLLQFHESNTNLIALLLWLGYRRAFIPYARAARKEGKSAWTLRKKLRYCLDSIFNFTDLPVRLLLYMGTLGISTAILLAFVVAIARTLGNIRVPGYSALMIAVLLFGGVMSFGLGILGQYQWLTLNNARRRPNYIVAGHELWEGDRNDSPGSKVNTTLS
jgi:polyisoprenyl-phosphate glycosyltransferase